MSNFVLSLPTTPKTSKVMIIFIFLFQVGGLCVKGGLITKVWCEVVTLPAAAFAVGIKSVNNSIKTSIEIVVGWLILMGEKYESHRYSSINFEYKTVGGTGERFAVNCYQISLPPSSVDSLRLFFLPFVAYFSIYFQSHLLAILQRPLFICLPVDLRPVC